MTPSLRYNTRDIEIRQSLRRKLVSYMDSTYLARQSCWILKSFKKNAPYPIGQAYMKLSFFVVQTDIGLHKLKF